MKSWLHYAYSTHNGGKSVNAKWFIRILRNEICRYMASILKNSVSW